MASGIAVLRLHRRPEFSQSHFHPSRTPRTCAGFSRRVFGFAESALLFLFRGIPGAVATGSPIPVVEVGGAFVRALYRRSRVADRGSKNSATVGQPGRQP